MGIGTSIFLIAVGAILDFAVDVNARAVDIHTVGLILMIVGGLGLVLSLLFWNSWGGFGGARRRAVMYGDWAATTGWRGVGDQFVWAAVRLGFGAPARPSLHRRVAHRP